jgi:RNase H-fold protein (predicted Holliday junction resolvase)
MTLLACSIHFMPGLFGVHLPSAVSAILTFFCGFLPALGAALVGIVNQGEFLRVHKRSKAMKQQLKAILKEVKYLSNEIAVATSPLEEQYSQQVTALTANTARLLLHEVFDWRVVFLDRPLTTPP